MKSKRHSKEAAIFTADNTMSQLKAISRPQTSPLALIESLRRNRTLIFQATKREVIGRYKGSVLGIAWSFFYPLLMLGVYAFVFGLVFKAKWRPEVAQPSLGEFAVVMFLGLILHGVFAECVNRAPSLIVGNVNYVKRVVFPLECLAVSLVGSAIFHACISMVVLLITAFLVFGALPPTAPLIVLPIGAVVLLSLGVCWIVSSFGVYVRDMGQTISIITSVMLFMSPVFYPITALPLEYRWVVELNPLTEPINQARDLFLWGRVPPVTSFVKTLAFGAATCVFGYWWFQRTRTGFADVL